MTFDEVNPGIVVRIMELEEIVEVLDFDGDPREIVDQLMECGETSINGCVLYDGYLDFLGRETTIDMIDDSDHTVHSDEFRCWFPPEILVQVSEPGEFFGFKVGDLVEVKSRYEMESDGSLEYNWFVEPMRFTCGETAEITYIEPDKEGRVARVQLQFRDISGGVWSYSTGMLKHIDSDTVEPIQVSEWFSILTI